MSHINRDTVVAIVLLILTGVFFWASFEIREPNYGVLPPSAWPRLIIAALGLLSFVYLIQSVQAGRDDTGRSEQRCDNTPRGVVEFFMYWRNPIYCFALFLAFLLTLPVLGMLFGGISFVFLLLNMLGGWEPRRLIMHALIALLTIGTMWTIFTFVLKVILPTGIIFDPLR